MRHPDARLRRLTYAAGWLLAAVLFLGGSARAGAQARPQGAGRVWAELGAGGAAQTQTCRECLRTGSAGGPALTASAGLTLPRGFGAALVGRTFQAFSFEDAQASRYVVAVGQYAPPQAAWLTLNAGAGWARHRGDAAPDANNGEGAVLAAGGALRLPPRSRVALTATADVMQSVAGAAAAYRPRLLSLGLGLSMASAGARLAGPR